MHEHGCEEREAVMSEIKILAKFSHNNIVSYYGSFVEDNNVNVVMEYADGGTLFNRISSAKKPFPEDVLMNIFTQLLLCLDHMHKQKVLHRDLKTKNIFMTRNHVVKVGDFGLSKVLDNGISMAQSAVGTPYYLSPELCEGKPYDYKSDVWALGCVAHEMTSLKHTFHATNLPQLVMTIVYGKYTPVSEDYSSELRDMVHACLERDPMKRPDIHQMLHAPFVQAYLSRIEADEAALNYTPFCSRPFFEAGSIQTVIDQNRANGAVPTDAIMQEVQEEQRFLSFLKITKKEVGIADRVSQRVMHFQCFLAKELINFMCRELGIRARGEALRAAQKWMESGVFYHVSRSEPFVDGTGMYRFKDDEVDSLLNMKVQCEGTPRSAMVLEREVRAALTGMLEHVCKGNAHLVDYNSLRNSEEFATFQELSAELQSVDDLAQMSFNTKIALFINLFNALVIHGFVVLGPPKDLYQRIHFYNHTAYSVASASYSLNGIEHGLLRGNQKPPHAYCRVWHPSDPRLKAAVVVWDPRIHFALVRGTMSCPRLQVYDPNELDEMLTAATTEICSEQVEIKWLGDQTMPTFSGWSVGDLKKHLQAHGRDYASMVEKTEFVESCMATLSLSRTGQMARREILLPALFEWYKEDFGTEEGAVVYWVRPFLTAEKKADLDRAIEKDDWVIKYKPFDWTVNRSTASSARTLNIPDPNGSPSGEGGGGRLSPSHSMPTPPSPSKGMLRRPHRSSRDANTFSVPSSPSKGMPRSSGESTRSDEQDMRFGTSPVAE
eukprot:CAMPEP_0198206148 /NCGR_PEP_ID=MMETSP1445-20131203/9679_1 /TAXON_ID=36898 /ORGANISM="Pyramimonas sp., Strain CCMP2087" /LENGTH=776 /DNA_ID=CAMNT_0043878719 /DNA_START=210 /DNA_END=2540 /DNA_ORIENTATION=+